MEQTLLETYRQRLLQQQQEVVKRIFALEDDMHALEEDREIERTDSIQAEVPEEVLQQLDEQGRREVKAIQVALARLDAGTYGLCEACDKPIALARLDALPMAIWCVSCQEQAEKE